MNGEYDHLCESSHRSSEGDVGEKRILSPLSSIKRDGRKDKVDMKLRNGHEIPAG